jgi:hypothetical protein
MALTRRFALLWREPMSRASANSFARIQIYCGPVSMVDCLRWLFNTGKSK